MLSRRELLSAGVAGGLTSSPEPVAAAAREQSSGAELALLREIEDGVQDIGSALDRALLSNTVTFGMVAKVRFQMEVFFRTTQKFPDFLEVGLAVFLEIYDWHIKHRQQLVITRGPDARYWMQFMFTTIILRGEHDQNYIGIPYDKP
jgi:hypothetical protein